MAAGVRNPYQTNAIEHADPVKLVGLMYEGALRFIRRAQKAIADSDPEGAHNNIMRAYAIVAELMATLDFKRGGEIAAKLEQCYDYVLHLLKEANIKKDPAALATACALFEPLLATWNDAFAGGHAAVLSAPDHHNGNLAAAPPRAGMTAASQAAPEPAGAAAPPATPGRTGLDVVG